MDILTAIMLQSRKASPARADALRRPETLEAGIHWLTLHCKYAEDAFVHAA